MDFICSNWTRFFPNWTRFFQIDSDLYKIEPKWTRFFKNKTSFCQIWIHNIKLYLTKTQYKSPRFLCHTKISFQCHSTFSTSQGTSLTVHVNVKVYLMLYEYYSTCKLFRSTWKCHGNFLSTCHSWKWKKVAKKVERNLI